MRFYIDFGYGQISDLIKPTIEEMSKEDLKNLFISIKEDDVSKVSMLVIENNWFNMRFPRFFDSNLIKQYPFFNHYPSIISVAAYFGSYDVFQFLISNNADVQLRDEHNINAIGFAIRNSNINIVKYLFDMESIDQPTADDCFLFASEYNSLDSFQFCLSHAQFNPKAKNPRGRNCIHYAALNGNIELMNLLLQNGADINAMSTEGQSPLMLAAVSNNPDVVRFMLDVDGISMNLTNQFNDNAFILAAAPGRLENMKLMIEKGFTDINHQNDNDATALHIACINNRVDVVKYLLTLPGIDATLPDASSMNALFRSFFLQHDELVNILYEYLKERNTDQSLSIAINQRTSLMHLATEMNYIPYLDLLINTWHEDVNATGSQNEATPLQMAVEKGYLMSLEYLLGVPGRKVKQFHKNRRWNVGSVIVPLAPGVEKILKEKGQDILDEYMSQKKQNDEELAIEKAEKEKAEREKAEKEKAEKEKAEKEKAEKEKADNEEPNTDPH